MKSEKTIYSPNFFQTQHKGSLRSAEEIVPLIIKTLNPKSVVDVGCGTGAWLSVFIKYGIKDVLGIDGEWVDEKILIIPKEKFLRHDLRTPINIPKKFDLVISLEVAEHIPQEKSEIFIDSLTRLGPVILFSAAIPFQGGKGHVNEQWPEYWIKLFDKRGYVVADFIRKKIWKNKKIEPWYIQNILLFSKLEIINSNPTLKKEFELTNINQISIVHPDIYLLKVRQDIIFNKFVSLIPAFLRKIIKKFFNI